MLKFLAFPWVNVDVEYKLLAAKIWIVYKTI